MRKASILSVLIVAGLAFGANDAWRTKPYQQWDRNDVKEVLSNSPWVKHITVPASWLDGGTVPSSPQNPAGRPPVVDSENSDTGETVTSDHGAPGVPEQLQASFFVRWSSAQTVREAVARNAVLNGQYSEAQAEQYVNQEPSTYQVYVYGPDMLPFAVEDETSLKSRAYLEIKPSKEKINPSSVEISRDAKGRIVSVLFSFPKQANDGKPLIAANEKQAQFQCRLRQLNLEEQFDLRKMTGKNGADL